jgi:hypothetical protein
MTVEVVATDREFQPFVTGVPHAESAPVETAHLQTFEVQCTFPKSGRGDI